LTDRTHLRVQYTKNSPVSNPVSSVSIVSPLWREVEKCKPGAYIRENTVILQSSKKIILKNVVREKDSILKKFQLGKMLYIKNINSKKHGTVEPRYSAIEAAEKNSHKIEVRTISRSILKVFLLKGPKIFRTKSRFALYLGSTVFENEKFNSEKFSSRKTLYTVKNFKLGNFLHVVKISVRNFFKYITKHLTS
jgi:hypothetical protein